MRFWEADVKNVEDFVKWGLSHVKRSSVPSGAVLPVDTSAVGADGEWEYLFGTTGRVVTQALLDKKYKYPYAGWGWTRNEYDEATKGWIDRKAMVCDCQGVEDAFSKSDTNAKSNYAKYCTDKGKCAAINRNFVIGEAVFMGTSTSAISHVGWICGFDKAGAPLVMEERGLSYGFVVTKYAARGWDYRGLMTKRYIYGQKADENTKAVFTRTLKYGCSGDDVCELKKLLLAKGYDGLTLTNKNYRTLTRNIVRKYQADNCLTIDGMAGKQTITALGGAWEG